MSGLSQIADEIVAYLQPIVDGLEFPNSLQKLLNQVGAVNGADAALVAALTTIVDFGQQCETLASQSQPSFEAAASLLELSRRAFTALSALNDAGGAVAGVSSLGEDLAELLAGIWLVSRHPKFYSLGVLLSLIQPDWDQTLSADRPNAAGTDFVRYGFKIDRLRPSRIVDLIRDPVGTLRAEYASPLATDADAVALADKLFPRLQLLFSQLGLPCRYGISPEDTADLKDWAAPMAHAFIVYVQSVSKGANADVGVVITISPASQGDLGLVIAPFGDLNLSRQVGSWTVAAQVAASVDVLAWGRNGPALLATSGATDLTASVTATLPPPAQGPAVVFGAPTGTRLEVGGATASAAAHLAQTGSSLAFNADVTKSKLVIAGGDSFVSSLLPDNGLEANFNLGIGWSSDKGLTLRGSAGLQTDVPVSLSVGGVTLSQLHLALLAGDAGVTGEISGILSASIGPVQAAIDRVGIAANLSFPDKGGNLGGGELAVGFKPPSGVGIALDMQGLTGGGFLTHDEATGNYGGVLQLSLQETITLTGYGIIGTKMPDGSPGYSLLVFITAEDFGGIQLGFGLVLQSIGGMVGIHRTFDLNVIRSGLRSDSLATLLFPRDPVANAPALLQALAASFPARQGSYLFGLLARITWLTPTVVQADLAVILELGQRSRLLVLGRVSAMLPSHDNDLIRLILDADGVLDFNAKTFDADAVLVNSRIAHQFPVTGSAAVRSSWSDNANFVLAAGGLNPHFAPPTGFPQLERVAIALSSGNNPRLICDAYLAVTANTVQFGSRVSLYAEAFSFSITGDLGFDALVTLEPPHFLIDFHASVQLKQGSTNLFKVTVDGTLEGPLPLRLHAKATFEILWFDFSVNFDFTLANGDPGQLPAPAVALEGKVMAALADPANWTAQHEANLASGVAFRALPAGAPPVLDPLGQFTVKQQVAPLNTQRAIDTYGGATVAGAKHFALVAAFNNQPATPVEGAFVPARYFTMSDDDELAAPSFETMDAGVALGDGSVSFDAGGIVAASVEYDEFVVNPAPAGSAPAHAVSAAPPAPAPYKLPTAALRAQRAMGAAARAPVRNVGGARFRNTGAAPAATIMTPGWRAAPAVGMTPAAARAPAVVTTWSAVKASLATLDSGGDRWLAVPVHELLT